MDRDNYSKDAEGARTGTGLLKYVSLLAIGSIVVAMIAAEATKSITHSQPMDSFGVDYTTTGSITRSGSYTVRQSVLQPTPSSVCIIHANGSNSGEC